MMKLNFLEHELWYIFSFSGTASLFQKATARHLGNEISDACAVAGSDNELSGPKSKISNLRFFTSTTSSCLKWRVICNMNIFRITLLNSTFVETPTEPNRL